mgnify:CR=1 FL=1
MAGRFLKAFKPISRYLPEVAMPDRRVSLSEKIFWTLIVLGIYYVMCEIPLYGVGKGEDPLTYLRVIFASSRGSLMELGIGPIVTAGIILQLLAASDMIECNFAVEEDRALFTAASKFLSIVLTGVNAAAYIIGGVYGKLEAKVAMIVFLELLATGIVLILLDELLQKGWGLGSGISLFILAGVAKQIWWQSFAPIMMGDKMYYGGVLATIQAAINRDWKSLFLRSGGYPCLLGLITTVTVFLICMYMQGMRVEIPISYARFRGYRGRYPISLLYVSNIPVIFTSALFANIYLWSHVIWSNFNKNNTNFWLNLIGTFKMTEQGLRPVGGLVYYVISPGSLTNALANPLQSLVYMILMISFCAVFSITWLEVGGLDPRTVARQLVDAGMQVPGFRRSSRPIEALLKRYIPTVTILGGILVGLLAAFSDFLGAYGTGTGILLSVGIIYQYYQILMQERISEMYPALRKFLE